MPCIKSVGTALPNFKYSLEDIKNVGGKWLNDKPMELGLFKRFLTSSRTNQRYFCIPAEEVLKLNGLQNRAGIFEEYAPILGETAISIALNNASLDAHKIDSLVFTSCSCPTIPSIDGVLIDRVGFKRTTPRIPIYQQGCAGGVVGLELASSLSKAGQTVALASVELCSLVFQPSNPTPAQLVGAAIFADGAACAIVSPEDRGMTIQGQESYLIPNSRHLMGYDLLDDGFHLRLDKELPQILTEVAPERVNKFLDNFNLTSKDISYWLFHPGGIKILDFLESTFRLKPEQAHWSRDTLSTVGNLSSATVLFVLKSFLDSKVCRPGDNILMLGIGPGLTLELILFQYKI